MSKTISVALLAALAGGDTALATCLKLTRTDGVIMGATTSDQNVAYLGVTYLATAGGTMSDVESTASLAVQNGEMRGLLNLDSILDEDLHAGLYDYAAISVFVVNTRDLTQGAYSQTDGWIGQVTTDRMTFVAELRGLAQALTRTIGRLCSPGCSAKLGDSLCRVDLDGSTSGSPSYDLTVTGTIDSVDPDNASFTDSARTEPEHFFRYGIFTPTSGACSGRAMEVKTYDTGEWVTQLPMPYLVAAGDTYEMTAGCDKLLTTCSEKFDNVLNFQGRPYVPGQDKVVQVGRRT